MAKIRVMKTYAIFLCFYFIPTVVYANTKTFKKAGKALDNLSAALAGLGAITITCATLWVGYKVLFGGSTLRECTPIIVGGLIIGSAFEIAAFFV